MPLLLTILLALQSLSTTRLATAAPSIGGQPYVITSLCLHSPQTTNRLDRCNKTVSFALHDPEPRAPTHTVCSASWPGDAKGWPTNWMRVSWVGTASL
jgi:hypothetical protein